MVALATPAVPASWYAQLGSVGWKVHAIEEVPEFWWGTHPRCKTYEADQHERWGHMASKLRLWQLTQFEQVLYIDADSVLLAPADELFELRGFAAEAGTSHAAFNAGVMLLQPSLSTFDVLLQRGRGPITAREVMQLEGVRCAPHLLFRLASSSSHDFLIRPASIPLLIPTSVPTTV